MVEPRRMLFSLSIDRMAIRILGLEPAGMLAISVVRTGRRGVIASMIMVGNPSAMLGNTSARPARISVRTSSLQIQSVKRTCVFFPARIGPAGPTMGRSNHAPIAESVDE